MGVRIVTDSTAYLPSEVRAAHPDVIVVPLHAIIDGEEIVEGAPGSVAAVADALRAGRGVSTSRPSPQSFFNAYETAVREGATGIVSVHLSGALSATFDGARTAAEAVEIPIAVVDSRLIGMAMGYAVCAADDLARGGASLDEIVADCEARLGRSRVFFYVDSLEYLRRGGRIGAAAALLGTALSVKPILTFADGAVVVRDKVRTAGRALDRLAALALAEVASAGGDADVAIHHLDSPERVAALTDHLTPQLGAAPLVADLGAVVGAHTGPGVIAIAVTPRGALKASP